MTNPVDKDKYEELLLSQALMLQENSYAAAEIPSIDLNESDLFDIAVVLAMHGITFAWIIGCAGCDEVPDHKENPIPHKVIMAKVENPRDSKLRDKLKSILNGG
jgi:hypothetical protein